MAFGSPPGLDPWVRADCLCRPPRWGWLGASSRAPGVTALGASIGSGVSSTRPSVFVRHGPAPLVTAVAIFLQAVFNTS